MSELRALLVYESMFGNTRDVAAAAAAGLATRLQVDVTDVAAATEADAVPWDLIVAGAPTHAFSLSRPSTRAEAIDQGATGGSVQRGMRDWLAHLPPATEHQQFACFDTRATAARHLPGSAARKIARKATALGFPVIGRESFWVSGTPGPLMADELDRARQWGVSLGEGIQSTRGHLLLDRPGT